MKSVLIIGLGGVGRVVAHKCSQVPNVFTRIYLASRTKSRCDEVKESIGDENIQTAQVDANHVDELVKLIEKFKPNLIINTALPYQDLAIMEACLNTGVHYLDTANYEPEDEARFCYKWQWDLHDKFREKGIMALLGCGFDPGVTNIFCAYAKKMHFDELHYIDIMDANGGDHGHPFATNFNPEINIREVTQEGKYYQEDQWITVPALSVHRSYDFPALGEMEMYLMYHEELESLVKHFPEIKRIRFWMTFSEKYLNHLKVLEDLGLTSIEPILFEDKKIVPLKFLKSRITRSF